jgi:tryptophan synthase alpha chain
MSLLTTTPASQRYKNTFAQLAAKKQGAFIPFVIIGDPTAEESFDIIKTLIDAGADALELGIPFSDPSADGITIQKAALRAIKAGITTDSCLSVIAKVRAYAPHIPIGLLLYGNLVFARGIDKFYRDMAEVGVDSVLIADLPIRESEPFRAAALKYGIAPIFIAPPNASDNTLQAIAKNGQAYTYVLSRAGVTGVEQTEKNNNTVQSTKLATKALLDKLKTYQAPPAVIGFGISTPLQVKSALATGASGAISGSAVVKIIEENLGNKKVMLTKLAAFIDTMKAATNN